MNDPIGDMLTRIRNAQMRGKSTVETPASKQRAASWMCWPTKATSAATSPRPATATRPSRSA
jgi:hypothetical protein